MIINFLFKVSTSFHLEVLCLISIGQNAPKISLAF